MPGATPERSVVVHGGVRARVDVLQGGAPEVRYTPVPEAVISEAAQQAAMRRIRDVSLQLALRSAATMHTFVQVCACALAATRTDSCRQTPVPGGIAPVGPVLRLTVSRWKVQLFKEYIGRRLYMCSAGGIGGCCHGRRGAWCRPQPRLGVHDPGLWDCGSAS